MKPRVSKRKIRFNLFDCFNYMLMVLLGAICIYPFIYVASVSISDSYAVAKGSVRFLPVGFDITAYRHIFKNTTILTAYMNTIRYSVVGTLITLFITCLIAYPLSLRYFYGKGVILFFFTVPMFFSGGMIPTYLLIRDLRMLNSIWAIVLPSAVAMWNIVMVRTNFQQIPESLYESAYMDGANHWIILFKIILPLSKPIIAVILMFSMVRIWNDFFTSMLYLTSMDKMPLQYVLRSLVISQSTSMQTEVNMAVAAGEDPFGLRQKLKMGAIIVSIGPIILIYPFLQKYFIKGALIGAIKA
ncbi:MAG: carbohydrate ABC transporter permease [Oscillospiraceae bacterium]|nr:carbohydrate ABC transporter permease [Oscillospiraceae bacterium]